MKCPTCSDVVLVMSERQGVEIDYCPNCRGVWLDRGELDKIIERASAEVGAVPPATAPPPPPPAATPPRYDDRRDERRYEEKRYDDRPRYKYDDDKYKKKRKKSSFLEDLFEF